jgi:hypothetical protein
MSTNSEIVRSIQTPTILSAPVEYCSIAEDPIPEALKYKRDLEDVLCTKYTTPKNIEI